MYIDGPSNKEDAGARIVLISPEGFKVLTSVRFCFSTTNNVTEYEALIARLNIPRDQNTEAGALSHLGSSDLSNFDVPVYVEHLSQQNTDPVVEVMIVDIERCWMDHLLTYLRENMFHEDKKKARRIQAQAGSYVIHDEVLYKKSHSFPLLRCVPPSKAEYIIAEPIPSSIPFVVWGMDITEPFPQAKGQLQYILVAIDYFTKWIKVKTMTKVTAPKAVEFFRLDVLYRYGIPQVLITDNGLQFSSRVFYKFYHDHCIGHRFASMVHLEANG
ncbi:hypothetical protein NE237_013131 [Protea cynaroides]|uniref:Integrase catalytic domain-containing protein n=1 Tax=Protea cynaroides TaxID=273540 RepID=A0A9Q0H150_9MAGN|nr:hypothetical protein NE237_013131 [Protea cynaroides]